MINDRNNQENTTQRPEYFFLNNEIEKIKDKNNEINTTINSIVHKINLLENINVQLVEIKNDVSNLKANNDKISTIENEILFMKSRIPNLFAIIAIITFLLGFFGYSNMRQVQDEALKQYKTNLDSFTKDFSKNIESLNVKLGNFEENISKNSVVIDNKISEIEKSLSIQVRSISEKVNDKVNSVSNSISNSFSKISNLMDNMTNSFNEKLMKKLNSTIEIIEKQQSHFRNDSEAMQEKISGVISSLEKIQPDSLVLFNKKLKEISNKLTLQNEKIKTVDKSLARLATEISLVSNESFTKKIVATDTQPDALSLITGLLSNDNSSVSYLAKATKAMKDNEYEQARQYTLKAQSLDSDNDSHIYPFIIARSFLEEKKYRKALVKFEEALLKKPNDSSVLDSIGTCYYKMSQDGKYKDNRQEYLQKALEYHKRSYEIEKDESVILHITYVLNNLGRYNESLEFLKSIQHENNPRLLYQISATHSLIGNYLPSIEYLKKSFSLDKRRCLIALADDDFKNLRKEEAFINLLKQCLGDELVNRAQEVWSGD